MATDGGTGTRPGAVARPRRRRALTAVVGVVVAVAAIVFGAVVLTKGDSSDGGAGDDRDERLDVAIVGDSLIEQSRDQFRAHAEDQGLSVETFAFGGSAPCDWMDVFEDFAASRPRQLIISFAGNDSTPCINPGGGPPRDPQTIADAYAVTVPEIVDLYADTDTEVYVVLPPPVGEPASEPTAVAIRSMYRDLANDRPAVTLVDPAPLLGPDGQFHLTLACVDWESAECDAAGSVTVRKDDGIHLTPAGGERYARTLLDATGHPVDG